MPKPESLIDLSSLPENEQGLELTIAALLKFQYQPYAPRVVCSAVRAILFGVLSRRITDGAIWLSKEST